MPTYQYACTHCGEQLEVQQRFTDDPLTTCPACAGRLRKVFNAVGVVFKGSGFYRTDSRAQPADGGKADAGKGDGGDGGKADGKPAGGKTDSGTPANGKPAGSSSSTDKAPGTARKPKAASPS